MSTFHVCDMCQSININNINDLNEMYKIHNINCTLCIIRDKYVKNITKFVKTFFEYAYVSSLTPIFEKYKINDYTDEHTYCSNIKYSNMCIIKNDLDECIKLLFDQSEDRKSTRLNSSHSQQSRMPSSA